MIYLFESELKENKSVFFALTDIYGIGRVNAFILCRKLGLSANLKIKALSSEQINKLVKTIESADILLAGDLKKSKLLTSRRLLAIKSYRGLRKNQGLPIRGQRTHTNAKTAKKSK